MSVINFGLSLAILDLIFLLQKDNLGFHTCNKSICSHLDQILHPVDLSQSTAE